MYSLVRDEIVTYSPRFRLLHNIILLLNILLRSPLLVLAARSLVPNYWTCSPSLSPPQSRCFKVKPTKYHIIFQQFCKLKLALMLACFYLKTSSLNITALLPLLLLEDPLAMGQDLKHKFLRFNHYLCHITFDFHQHHSCVLKVLMWLIIQYPEVWSWSGSGFFRQDLSGGMEP